MHRANLAALLVIAAAGCGGTEGDGAGPAGPGTLLPSGKPALTVIASAADGLSGPRDLAFDPGHDGQMWIVSERTESVTIVFDATSQATHKEHLKDAYAVHFMANVDSIAFGDRTFENDWTFGTCGDSENTYDDTQAPNDFMGPVLWSANLDVFAAVDPIGLGSHLDMLHESPDCMGIAHETQNVYWVFDGFHSRLARYNFQKDHGPGMDDHSDGIIAFLDEPDVKRSPGIPSSIEYDRDTGILYVADTGHARVLRVDPSRIKAAGDLVGTEHGTVVREMTGVVWKELVPASSRLLRKPSGLALHEGVLYVGDAETGSVLAFDEKGKLLARMATGLPAGALMGLEVGPDRKLYLVDGVGDEVLRLDN